MVHSKRLGNTDNSDTSCIGFNVCNGVIFVGEFPRSQTPFDYYFLTGTFSVSSSSFNTMGVGVSQDGFLKDTLATIGGASSAGNVFENLFVGMDIEASQSSVFNISYNSSSGIYAGMWVVPWQPVFVPTSASRYMIHDNQFSATGQYAEGMLLSDNTTNPWIQAAVWNNTVELQDTMSEGIGVYNTKGTAIWNNSVTGSGGFDAIGLWSSTFDAVSWLSVKWRSGVLR